MGNHSPKRTPNLSDERLHDVWNVRELDYGEGELANFDQLISSAVARCLEGENRTEIAETLSYILDERVTAHMLNAYASEARRAFKIPTSRFLALIAVSRRFDILDAVCREVGGKALDRHDARKFRVGVHYLAHLNTARALREDVTDLFAPFEP